MSNATKVAKVTHRNVAPILPHDCAKCRFVGRLDGSDIYVCGDEIVVRQGWEDNDYGCWPVRLQAPAGSPYSFAQRLLVSRLRPGVKLVPNDYRS